MNKVRVLLLTCIILIGFDLSACSYNNVFEIDKNDYGVVEDIIGIQDLYNAGAKNVNIVFVHGMGYHLQSDEMSLNGVTRLYQNRLASELGFKNNHDKNEPIDLLLRNSSIVGGKLHWRKFNDGNGKTLNMFALSWDEVTVQIQKAMFELDDDFYEKGGSLNREKERVFVNRELKRFINRSFADPAIYIGTFGKEIRHLVAQGISIIDKILNDNDYLDDSKTNQIVIISDSLGSSVIFDTVKETLSIDKGQNFAVFESMQRFAGLSTLIFMNANQLPLIELGRIEAPTSSEDEWLNSYPCPNSTDATGILGFVEKRNNAMQLKAVPEGSMTELQLVAFTDPNDALSYYLTSRFKDRCSGDKVKIVNVLLTNAKWNYLFIFADPEKAHTSGFKTNDTAVKVVVEGVH